MTEYIDMGIWMCRTKYIDPHSIRRDGKNVSIKIEGRTRVRIFKSPEQAELFKHYILAEIEKHDRANSPVTQDDVVITGESD